MWKKFFGVFQQLGKALMLPVAMLWPSLLNVDLDYVRECAPSIITTNLKEGGEIRLTKQGNVGIGG